MRQRKVVWNPNRYVSPRVFKRTVDATISTDTCSSCDKKLLSLQVQNRIEIYDKCGGVGLLRVKVNLVTGRCDEAITRAHGDLK